MSDISQDGHIPGSPRYHSLWPLTGGHEVRPAVLDRDLTINPDGSPGDYHRVLATGDIDGLVAASEPRCGRAQTFSRAPYT